MELRLIDVATASLINNLLGSGQHLTYLIFRDLAVFHLKAVVILDEEFAKRTRFHSLPYLLSSLLVNTIVHCGRWSSSILKRQTAQKVERCQQGVATVLKISLWLVPV